MQITINGETSTLVPDITEENLGSFLQNLELSFEMQGSTLTSIRVNGTSLTADSLDSLWSMELEKVHTLDLETANNRELLYKAFRYSRQLLEKAQEQQGTWDPKEWIHSPAARLIEGQEPVLYHHMVKVLRDLPHMGEYLLELLTERETELLEAEKLLQDCLTQLSELTPRLENVGILFQTGRDKEVAQLIHDFSLTYERCLRLISYLYTPPQQNLYLFITGEKALPAFIEELNTFLENFIQAYGNQDTILAGDLAEYEIAPRVRELCTALRSYLVANEPEDS
ncbi:MAG TPA: hypothetical protein PLW34_03760 [Termitinemataceae bacterium]|uniref:hypothetical protein n=1 Tax=Treponema sp. J25 TaxID=2094121 RepID=UPI00104EB5B2|nr:hypothetical protein [Treponema sp. J25]TCW62543.1 hypothetical protein C5O22_00350 [Treponema sp. J25]HOJ98658.1 hypothetical protein [Termitinemataceae bacterium]HOM23577.1 hypothetical protein [Termitinemataceae bacterium]HPP99842.1 hypothetical protein [Termitinemataceae bacterium]